MLGTEPIASLAFSVDPILNEVVSGSIDTSWAIKNGNIKDFSYKIFNKTEIETAYKVFALIISDTAWKIKNSGSKDLSYKIYKLTHHETSWNILTLGSKNISWSIYAGHYIDTSYRIHTINTKDTSWNLGADNVSLDTVIFKVLEDQREFLPDKITIAFNEEDSNIVFYLGD